MNNEELKKKILTIVRGAMLEADELPFIETTDNIADALIAAGYGDVKEAEHRAEVAELAFKKYLEKEACCFCNYKKINYCEATKESQEECFNATIETYVQQAEKELAEEMELWDYH